jgi:high-affinity Fe2+/Pb2+ permease
MTTSEGSFFETIIIFLFLLLRRDHPLGFYGFYVVVLLYVNENEESKNTTETQGS